MITPEETAVHDIVLAEVVHGRIATLVEAKAMAAELIAARKRHRQAEAKARAPQAVRLATGGEKR